MPASVTLAQLADISHDVNSVGNAIGGQVVRDRFNQPATVIVTDHPDAGSDDMYFTNRRLHDRWDLGGRGKLGNFYGNTTGPNYVLPT